MTNLNQTALDWTSIFEFEYCTSNNSTLVRLKHYDEEFKQLAHQKRARWNSLLKAWSFNQSIEELTPRLESIHKLKINEIQKITDNLNKTTKLIQRLYGNDNDSYLFKNEKISISFLNKENCFNLQFPYNFELIAFVKQMRGSRFDFEHKSWKIPHKHFKKIHQLALSLIRVQKNNEKNIKECFDIENKSPLFDCHPLLKQLFNNIYLNKTNNHYVFEGFCQFESSEFDFYSSFVSDYLRQEHQLINKNDYPKIPNFNLITNILKPSDSLPHKTIPYISFPAIHRELLEKSLFTFAHEHIHNIAKQKPIFFSFDKPNGFKMKSVAASCIYINKQTYECFYIYKINNIKKTPHKIHYEANAIQISPVEAQKKILNNRAIYQKTAIISSIEIDSLEQFLEGAIIANQISQPTQKLNKSFRL